MIWFQYLKKRGTINIARKIEQMVGLSNALFVSANSRSKVRFEDFMQHEYAKKQNKTQAEKIQALFQKIGTKNE